MPISLLRRTELRVRRTPRCPRRLVLQMLGCEAWAVGAVRAACRLQEKELRPVAYVDRMAAL